MKNKISGLLTTYNESQYLDECLQRLSFCDEIIVVDLGSSDKSVEIAESYGCTILHHELVPFAEKVRNFAIGHAKNDWLLFMDPDMYFPRGVDIQLDDFLSSCPENIGVIHLPAKKYFQNKAIIYGTKGAIESRQALLHRKRVDFLPLVHYSGISPKEGIFAAGMVLKPDSYIEHHWVNTTGEAIEKALRYLPHEAERRHHLYKRYSLKVTIKEFYKTITKDLRLQAYKDWNAFWIFLFNIWYLIDANIRWIVFEIRKSMRA